MPRKQSCHKMATRSKTRAKREREKEEEEEEQGAGGEQVESGKSQHAIVIQRLLLANFARLQRRLPQMTRIERGSRRGTTRQGQQQQQHYQQQ